MGEYQLSRKADEDLDGIYEYSIRQFGQKVADEYFLSLTDCLIKLAENPALVSCLKSHVNAHAEGPS
jgi:toxin ParE1/3/4